MADVGVPVHALRGPAIRLVSGRMFHLLDPRPEEIDVEDIAHAISRLCRYTGHVSVEHYSVAQHCVFVSRVIPERFALWGLLHDATEAYIGDVSRPLKDALDDLAPGVLKAIEVRIAHAIARRYGLEWPMPPEVKVGDNIALATERRDLMMAGTTWPNMPEPDPRRINALPAWAAQADYIARFNELTEEE